MAASGLTLEILMNEVILSVVFCGIGLAIMWVAFYIVTCKVNVKKELIEDENIALAVMFAGFFIAVAIIIAAAIK